jgi:hypothetical protein
MVMCLYKKKLGFVLSLMEQEEASMIRPLDKIPVNVSPSNRAHDRVRAGDLYTRFLLTTNGALFHSSISLPRQRFIYKFTNCYVRVKF